MRNRKGICLLLAALLFAGTLYGCAGKQQDAPLYPADIPAGKEQSFQEYEVTCGTFEKEIATSGYLAFLNSTEILLEEDGAVLAEDITVKSGDTVSAGDVLATFSLPFDESEWKIRNLEYSQAQSEYQSACSQYESQIASKQASLAGLTGTDLQIAELELESLKLDMQQYKQKQTATLEKLQKQIDDMEADAQPFVIRAPISGVVYSVPRTGEAGTSFDKETVLFTMYETTDALVKCSSMEYQNFLVGMEAYVYSTASAVNFNTVGRVVASPHAITDETLDNDFVYLRIEDEAALEQLRNYCAQNKKSLTDVPLAVRGVAIRIENALLLNKSAVHYVGKAPESVYESCTAWVYVRSTDGGVSRREIIVGPSDGNTVCVFDGLEAGERVINYY